MKSFETGISSSEGDNTNRIRAYTASQMGEAIKDYEASQTLKTATPEQVRDAYGSDLTIEKTPDDLREEMRKYQEIYQDKDQEAILGSEMEQFAEDAFENMERYEQYAFYVADSINFLNKKYAAEGKQPLKNIVETGPGPGVWTHFIGALLQDMNIDAYDISQTSVEQFTGHMVNYLDANSENFQKYGVKYLKAALRHAQSRHSAPSLELRNNINIHQGDFHQLAEQNQQEADVHIGRHWAHRPDQDDIKHTLNGMIDMVRPNGGLVVQSFFVKKDETGPAARLQNFYRQIKSKDNKPDLQRSFIKANLFAPKFEQARAAFAEICAERELDMGTDFEGKPLTDMYIDDIGSLRVRAVRNSADNLTKDAHAQYGGAR